MKKDDIMAMSDEELRTLVIEQQRKIERLYKAQVKFKRNIEAKQAVIEHLQSNNARHIVEAVKQIVPLKQSGY